MHPYDPSLHNPLPDASAPEKAAAQPSSASWFAPATYPAAPDTPNALPPPEVSTPLDSAVCEPLLYGHALPGCQVLALLDGGIRRRVPVDEHGCFVVPLPPNLAAGEHELVLYQADGHHAPTVLTLQFYTEAPLLPAEVKTENETETEEASVFETALPIEMPEPLEATLLDDDAPDQEALGLAVAEVILGGATAALPPVDEADASAVTEPPEVVLPREVLAEAILVEEAPPTTTEATEETAVIDAPDMIDDTAAMAAAESAEVAVSLPSLPGESPSEPALFQQVRLFDFPARQEAPPEAATKPVILQPRPAPQSSAPIDAPAPTLALRSARTGAHFRSILLEATAEFAADQLLVHTLLLPAGSPPPQAGAVVDFADAEALTSGGAARSLFLVDAVESGQLVRRTLAGREGIRALRGETGLLDGCRYDVYAVAVTPDGRRSEMASLRAGALAMPFSGGEGTPEAPYLLRQLTSAELGAYPDLQPDHPLNRAGVQECARMLDNIEGMRVLYDQTNGAHGLPDALRRSYRLTTSFDLSAYVDSYGELGWRPIGDVDADPAHVFSGTLESIHPSIAITGLRQHGGLPRTCWGLIGALHDATLRGLWLDHPRIRAITPAGRQGYVGAIAGKGDGLLDSLRVTHGDLSAACADQVGGAWLGGIIGTALDGSQLRQLSLTDSVLTGDAATAAIGGLAGLLSQTTGGQLLLTDSTVHACQLSGGARLGGAAAFAQGGAGRLRLHALRIDAELHGTDRLGMLLGLAQGAHGEALVLTDCQAAGEIVGLTLAGGLIGEAFNLRAERCFSSVQVAAENLAGGLLGAGETLRLERCATQAIISVSGSGAGGLVARALCLHAQGCCAQGKVNATTGLAGGLVAELSGRRLSGSSLVDCAFDGVLGASTQAALVAQSTGSVRLLRCLIAGVLTGLAGAAGFLASNDGRASVVNCAALAAEIISDQAQACARIALPSAVARLRDNWACDDLVLIAAEQPLPARSDRDGPDGASVPADALPAVLKNAAWAERWNLSPLADGQPPLLLALPAAP